MRVRPPALTQFAVLLSPRRWKDFFPPTAAGTVAATRAARRLPDPRRHLALDGLPQIKNLNGRGQRKFFSSRLKHENGARPGTHQDRRPGLGAHPCSRSCSPRASWGSNKRGRAKSPGETADIFEKEKILRACARPAYVAIKGRVSSACSLLVQSVWMAVFVNVIVQFQGSPASRQIVLLNARECVAHVRLPRAFRALMKTAEPGGRSVSVLSQLAFSSRLRRRGARALPKGR